MKIKWKNLLLFSLMFLGSFFVAACNNISNSNNVISNDNSLNDDLSSSEIIGDEDESSCVFDNIEYRLYDNMAFALRVIDYDVTLINVPYSIKIKNKEYIVTSLDHAIFENCNKLEEISLPFIGAEKQTSRSYLGYIFGATSEENNNDFIPSSLKKVKILST